ncbi:MAG: hypothetical protein QM820_65450 [Minicystis sp.]
MAAWWASPWCAACWTGGQSHSWMAAEMPFRIWNPQSRKTTRTSRKTSESRRTRTEVGTCTFWDMSATCCELMMTSAAPEKKTRARRKKP